MQLCLPPDRRSITTSRPEGNPRFASPHHCCATAYGCFALGSFETGSYNAIIGTSCSPAPHDGVEERFQIKAVANGYLPHFSSYPCSSRNHHYAKERPVLVPMPPPAVEGR